MPFNTLRWNEHELSENGFSCDEIRHLQNMQQGDCNNKKGTFYEKLFAVHILLTMLSDCRTSQNLPSAVLSNCEQAFVDDLTRIEAGRHINYQLKNSNTGGNLSGGLLEKFLLQLKMDKSKYPEKSCISILVCSDSQTVEKNLCQLSALPDSEYFDSLFFPYHSSFFEALIDDLSDWRTLLSRICPHEAQHETALQIMASVFDDKADWRMTVHQAWEKITQAARPNIFSFGTPDLPKWFVDKCTRLGFTLETDSICYKDFKITLSEALAAQINQMSENELADCHDARLLLIRLMRLNDIDGTL